MVLVMLEVMLVFVAFDKEKDEEKRKVKEEKTGWEMVLRYWWRKMKEHKTKERKVG